MGVREIRGSWAGSHLARVLAAVAVVAAAALIAACGGDDDGSEVEASASWDSPNADLRNTRWVEGEIDSANVDELGEAWSVPIEAAGTFGGYSATPVVVDGVAYTQDLESNVFAIDFETGEELWSQEYDSPNVGPNGVNVVEGQVYGATSTDAFALSAETGEELWSERLIRNNKEGIDMAPGYHEGTVYVSTVPGNAEGFYEGDGQAILWAMDAETGEEQWKWEEVPDDLWGDPDVNSGGGQWHPPAFDDEGDVYVAVANPAPFPGTKQEPWGESRPGENLYSNNCVKLDGETGELEWNYAALPHDVYDWDLQIGPILAESEDGDPVVLCAGKMGYVYGIDQDSGEELWKTAVGEHNGHDDDNLIALEERYDEMPETPFRILPGILGGVETQMAIDDSTVYVPVVNLASRITKDQEMTVGDVTEGTGEMAALDIGTGEVKWTHEFDSSPYGAASLVNDLVFTTTFDGTLWALNKETGEVEWEQELPAGTNAPVTIAGDTVITAGSFPQGKGEEPQIVAYRLGAEGAGEGEGDGGAAEGGGDQAAADGEQLFAQNCGSCHVLAAANTNGTVGPNLDDVQPDASATAEQVRNGGGGMPAFEGRLSEAEIEAVSEYVSSVAGQGGGGGDGGGGGGP